MRLTWSVDGNAWLALVCGGCDVDRHVLVSGFASDGAFAQSRLQDNELGKALVRGGYAILMRHAPADQDKADTDPLNFANTRAQQPLTEQGRAGAKAFGESMRAMGVTFSEVMASRFQRALQTAILAGYKGVKANTALTEGSLVVSPNENRRRAATLAAIDGAAVGAGAKPADDFASCQYRAGLRQRVV